MLLALAALLAPPAAACSFAVGGEHVVVDNPDDTTPPTDPSHAEVRLGRGQGPTCFGPFCGSDSCDDLGSIGITLTAAQDDVSTPDLIGYRVRLLEGTAPEGLVEDTVRRARVDEEGAKAHLTLAWGDEATDDQEPLDFTLGITAIDEAGNESGELEVFVNDPGSGCATVGGAGLLATALALVLAGGRRRR